MLPDRERSKNRENIVNETKNMEYVKVLIPFFFFFFFFFCFFYCSRLKIFIVPSPS